MVELFEIIFRSFWTFAGSFLILLAIGEIFRKFFNMLSIRKNGYPPSHCDADGDPIKPKED